MRYTVKDDGHPFDWYLTGTGKAILISGTCSLSGTADADVLPKSIQGLWAFEAADSRIQEVWLLKIGAKLGYVLCVCHDIKACRAAA